MKSFLSISLFLTLALSPFKENNQFNKLKINQIQVIGSHNSYKKAIDPTEFKMLMQKDSARFSGLDYEHIPLAEQLNMGLRSLEIDVWSDTSGGKYAHPIGLDMVKNQAPYPDSVYMKAPGFKVFHVTGLDFRSQCPTLKIAMQQLRTWSDAHPGHNPIFITIEPKDGEIKLPGFTKPEKFDSAVFDKLDQEMLTLGRDKIITPDDIRGNYPTLEAAVLKQNWPTVQAAKGKFLFLLDDHQAKRDIYISGHPSLKGRVIFSDSKPGTPEAAMMILNGSKREKAQIQEMVKDGYIVRTRADGDTKEARKNDYSSFEAAKESGAQILTTDYYLKSTHFKSDYMVNFTPGIFIRKNPVTAN